MKAAMTRRFDQKIEPPLQERPIYAFTIGPDGGILTRTYYRYDILSRGVPTYRMVNDYGGVVIKTEKQLDRFANGYYYSFTNDPDAARTAAVKHLRNRVEKAEAALQKAMHELDRWIK